jgi:hypothetical protein
MGLLVNPGVFYFNFLWFQLLLLFLCEEAWWVISAALGSIGLAVASRISVFRGIINHVRLGHSPLELVRVVGFADRERLHLLSKVSKR